MLAGAAEAVPVATTLSAAEPKRAASAVAVEMLRIRTCCSPHKENRSGDRELRAPRSTRT